MEVSQYRETFLHLNFLDKEWPNFSSMALSFVESELSHLPSGMLLYLMPQGPHNNDSRHSPASQLCVC